MPKISIVIPIYKVEPYLRECLDSVSSQSFDDFEVLCVDDGSPDGSADIVREKAHSDARFTLIEKDNGGVSSARNCGLGHARGEIIMFVDGDDALEANACERVAGVFADTGADVVMFGARVVPGESSTPWYDQVLSPDPAVFDSFEPQAMLDDRFSPFVWTLAVRRASLDSQGLRFDEDIAFGEDVVFQLALFPRVGRIARIPDKLYRYRLDRPGSFMGAYTSDERRLSAHLLMMDKIFEDWRALGLLDEYACQLKTWSQPYLLNEVERLPDEQREKHLQAVGLLWEHAFQKVGADPAALKVDCLCRGDGKLYVKCDIEASLPFSTLECSARIRTAPVPVSAYPFSGSRSGNAQSWVLELPLLEAPSISLELRPGGYAFQQSELKINYAKAKWLSRINYRLKARQCASIRDFERSFTYLRYQVDVTERFDAGSHAVWRLRVRWSGSPSRQPSFDAFDSQGKPIEAQWSLFEFQQAGKSSVSAENILFLSAKTSADISQLMIVARDASSEISSGFAVVDQGCFEELKRKTDDLMLSAWDDKPAYQAWLTNHRVQPGKAFEQRQLPLPSMPFFSVIILPRNGRMDGLSATLDSLVDQTYGSWEAIAVGCAHDFDEASCDDVRYRFSETTGSHSAEAALNGARGDYLAFMTCGDTLEQDALYEYRDAIGKCAADTDAPRVLYCDEDVADGDGSYERPLLKSRLNLDALYCRNWVGNFLAIERETCAKMAPCDEDALPAWLYDRVLRAYEACSTGFTHVPHVLYHALDCPLDSVPVSALGHALDSHLARRGVKAVVKAGPVEGSVRVCYDLAEPHPLVSVIIPTKDRIDLLDPCIRSILETCTYDAIEVLVIENNSTEDATFAYYERIQKEHPSVRVLRWPAEFNYSKLMNFGAGHAQGEYLLMLNNDTEVIEPSAIEEMMGYLQRPEVGVVGAKLLFRDDLVQHAGIGVGVWNAVVHVNQNKFGDDGGYLDRACLPGNFSAVTGACQMVRADVYREIGGYDERFAVGFNDIDFCMRIQESGRLVTFTPYALFHHYEFSSRGRETADREKMLRWKREQALFMELWPEPFVEGDPYAGPNLMRDNTYYRLSD